MNPPWGRTNGGADGVRKRIDQLYEQESQTDLISSNAIIRR